MDLFKFLDKYGKKLQCEIFWGNYSIKNFNKCMTLNLQLHILHTLIFHGHIWFFYKITEPDRNMSFIQTMKKHISKANCQKLIKHGKSLQKIWPIRLHRYGFVVLICHSVLFCFYCDPAECKKKKKRKKERKEKNISSLVSEDDISRELS